MKLELSKPVLRLLDEGLCSSSDVRDAISDGEQLSSPESLKKIRNAERLLGMVGEANRIKILLLFSNSRRELCVCELESALKLPQPTVSHHLTLLEQAGLLQRSKKGRWVFYKLKPSPIIDLLREVVLGVE
jgi:ArsR family transcriptional regulator, arsenate/arsenite/antimonite-responsive transcriptional repressor